MDYLLSGIFTKSEYPLFLSLSSKKNRQFNIHSCMKFTRIPKIL